MRADGASTTTAARCWSSSRSTGNGRNRVLVNRQKLGRARELLGRGAGHGVLARRSRAGEGGPGGAAAVHGRHAGRAGAEVRRAAPRARPHREAAQHPAEASRWPARRRRRDSPSTCGTRSWPRSATSSATPERCSSRASRRWSARPTSSSPDRPTSDRAALRAGVAPARPRRGAGRGAHRRRAPRRVDRRPASRRRRARSSTACRRAPTRRRASSARWRWRCAWRRIGCRRQGRAARRCWCSTTCSASSTRRGATALLRHLPPGQVVLTTAGVLPDAAHPDADRAHRSWHGDVVSRDPVPLGESLDRRRPLAAHDSAASTSSPVRRPPDGRRVRSLGRGRRRAVARTCSR